MDLRATLVGPISELDRLQWALVRSGCLPKLLGLRFSKTKLIMRPSRYVHMHKRPLNTVSEAIIYKRSREPPFFKTFVSAVGSTHVRYFTSPGAYNTFEGCSFEKGSHPFSCRASRDWNQQIE